MEFNKKGYYVRISETALLQMCLNSLEAYEVSHNGGDRKQTKLETFGQLYGFSRFMPDGCTLFNVDLVSIDTSAKQNTNSCRPNDKAMELKKDIMDSYWPQYEFLGDFHTHPYENIAEVNEVQGWGQSEADFDRIENEEYQADWHKQGYQLSIVFAIAKMQRKGSTKPDRIFNNTLRFDIGNFRCWLTAYVACTNYGVNEKDKLRFLRDEDSKKKILIDSSAVHGIDGEFIRFRRY